MSVLLPRIISGLHGKSEGESCKMKATGAFRESALFDVLLRAEHAAECSQLA